MTVRVTDPDAFDRLCAVEGAAYAGQRGGPERPNSFGAHEVEWAAWAADIAQAGESLASYASETVGEVIYGLGGAHRYFLRGDGRIVFSRRHASPGGSDRAAAAGFDLH